MKKQILLTIFLALAHTATAGNAPTQLRWQPNKEPDLKCYIIQRAITPKGPYTTLRATTITLGLTFHADGSTSDTLSIQATAGKTTGSLVTLPEFIDGTSVSGTVYFYRVFAMDTAGNVSEASEASGCLANDRKPPEQPKQVHFVFNLFSIIIKGGGHE